jgi:hypothetical protein
MVTLRPIQQALLMCDFCDTTSEMLKAGAICECEICGHDFCPEHYGSNFHPSEPHDDRSKPMDWGIDPGVMICCACVRAVEGLPQSEAKAKLNAVHDSRASSGKWPWPIYDWPKD